MVQEAVAWRHDLAEAREQAREARKLVLVDLWRTT
jgi:hypothetical protein